MRELGLRNRHLSRKRYEIRDMVPMVRYYEVKGGGAIRVGSLSDLVRQDVRGLIFQADLLNNARTVRSITIKFGRITREGGAYF